MLLFAGAFGTILFHLQHAVNSAYRADTATHSSARAAFEGSTCLAVAWPITWVTCNIEYHHIHHYSTRVPSYKLRECHESAPKGMWLGVTHVSFLRQLAALPNAMYDTETKTVEPFWPYNLLTSAYNSAD